MTPAAEVVVYWDSSAVLSALFRDRNSEDAIAWSRRSGVHLLSTLAWAEVHAVIARIRRERVLSEVLVNAAYEVLDQGPWRHVNASPEWQLVRDAASRWPLRGADLWHLAAAKSLQITLPELTLLAYDTRLTVAARGERLTSR